MAGPLALVGGAPFHADAVVEAELVAASGADEVVVVADSSKFGRQSLARLCDLSAPDILVVDDEISRQWRLRTVSQLKLLVAGGGA